MLRFLHRHILLPAFETGLKGRKTFRYLKELERSQWLSRAEVEALQFTALQQLVSHAFLHCPYYRDVWSERELHPDKLRTLADLRSWPVIDRDVIRAHRLTMRSQAAGMRLLSKSTGGSTGVPLHFDLDTGSHDWRTAAWHRGYGWAGAGPGAKELYLWSVPLGKNPCWQRWKDGAYNRFYRRLVLNTFELSEARAPAYLERLNLYRPDTIVAYTHSLYVFARALDEQRLRPYPPRSIIVGAEKLHSFERELIESVFQAPVFETYGCREVMLIGGECDRHEGLHLTAENLLVEILDDDGRPTPEGEEGSVVITDLHNYGMPFIRYANGDRAVAGWGVCSCGRGLPLLKKVVGRRSDMIHTPDGRHVSGVFFPHLVKEFPAIRQFQVIQDYPDHVQLRIVLGPMAWREADRNQLEHAVRRALGPQVRLDVLAVDNIPLSPAGKRQVVVNRCGPRNVLADVI